MKAFLAAAASGLLLCSAAAMAQTTPANQATPPQTQAGRPSPTLRADISESLGKAGFTNVRVMPDSFLVQATDKSGNPVAMFIGPNSVTELVTAQGMPVHGSAATTNGSGEFVTVDGADMVSSKVVGLHVRNDANQDIGTINDLALSGGAVQAYVLSVGGFLGVGDHDVAVSPAAMHITYDRAAKAWHATLDATQAQLKAAPAYTAPVNG